jgi:aminopeptidase YwaD
VFTGTESPYHRPEDVAGLLDYKGMALIADYLSDAILQLSAREKLSDLTGPGEGQAPVNGFIRPGVRLRLGSSHHNYLEEFYQGKSIFAAQAGLYASIRPAGFLTIQPELLYETRGSEHPEGNFRTHSVTVPLNLLISNPDDSGIGVKTYLQIGGYYSRHFAGKAGDNTIDFLNVYNNQEYGLTWGFGFEVMRFQYGVYFQRAFSGLYKDRDAERVIQENVYFQMGFTF